MRLLAHNDGRGLRGNERQLLLLAGGLRERGHDVLVSCREGAPLARALEGVAASTTHVRPRGDLALGPARAFRRLISERRPDVVLLTSWKRLFLGAWAARTADRAARASSAHPAPRVVARLGLARRMPERWWSAFKLRWALERVDALVVNSDAVRTAVTTGMPWLDGARVHVIRNAVAAAAGDPERLRRELGLAPQVRLVGVVGALEARKGVDLALRALAALPPHVHLAVAGAGPDAGRLSSLARSLSLGDRVHWLGARDDVGDVLAGSSAFLLPTRRDSIANALLEAMAVGTAVVTTAGNGAEETLAAREGRGAAGWIVPQEDPGALAAALLEALHAGDDARVAEARWRAAHWFGVERMVAEYEAVLSGGPRS